MKKFLYILFLLLGFLMIGNAYAVENYTAPQDTGGVVTNPDGSITLPKGNGDNGKHIGESTQSVANSGVKALDSITKTLLDDIDDNIKKKIQSYYQQITTSIIPIFGAFIVFWLIFNGIRMGMGAVVNYNDLLFIFACMVIIWTMIFSWDFFYPYVVELFTTDLDGLVAEMTGTDAKSSFMAFVNVALGAIADAMGSVDTGITNAVSGFFFVLIYALVFALICVACALFFLIVIVCKLVIGILLVVAPIFLACAMFPATRSYTRNWLQAILTPIVVNLLLIITCDLVMDSATKASKALTEGGSSFLGAWVLAIMTVIVILLFLIVPKIATALVGSGFEASSGASMGMTGSLKRMMTGKR